MNHIKTIEKLITRCEECKLKECINCEISWTEVEAIKKLLNKKGKEAKQVIEIGEYTRNKNGYIGKVENIIESDKYLKDIYYCCGTVMSSSYKNEITKHSKNIIDLVEVGDYVNGYKISGKEGTLLYTEIEGIDKSVYHIPISQYGEGIQTILTHELYKENCYKVGGKNEL